MISANMATPGFLKIIVFWNKGWHHNSCWWHHQQNFITWFKLYCRFVHVTKCGNSSISMREVITTSILSVATFIYSKFSVGNHMSVAEWADTYGIHHWQILWSSYRKFAWVWFEPMTTEFRSDALIDWTIRSWVQVALRANFLQLLQFHCLFSVTFHFGCFPSSVAMFI